MCRQLSIRSSVEGVLITLFTTFFFFSTWYVIINVRVSIRKSNERKKLRETNELIIVINVAFRRDKVNSSGRSYYMSSGGGSGSS